MSPPPSLQRLYVKATRKAHTMALSRPLQSWHPGQRSVFSTQGWAGCLALSIAPRNTYQETVKRTKLYYWETCRQIINLLGTIKAFRYFWLRMPVTHTYIQTSFFSPSEQFCTPLSLPASLFHKTNSHYSPSKCQGEGGDRAGDKKKKEKNGWRVRP